MSRWTRLLLLLGGCEAMRDSGADSPAPPTTAPGGNVLVVLVDDLGVDKVGAYGVHPDAPPTPNIDALAAEGLLFRNAWSYPTCSPTRASLLTGRSARRLGIGRWIYPHGAGRVFDPREVILPEMLRLAPVSVADAAVGKWHLAGFREQESPAMHPVEAGFSWHAGTLANPDNSIGDAGGEPKGYALHERSHNGELAFSTTYLTTETTDDALERLGALPEPWFLYVAYNAPHGPLHVPPDELHPYDLDPATATELEMYDAMVAALDRELGRLLAGIPADVRERTTIFFLSDNGTPANVIRPPLDSSRSKSTIFEGGVNVPFVVTGPLVDAAGTESDALVEVTDLFPTLAEIHGVDLGALVDPRTDAPVRLDGTSLLPHLLDPAARVDRERLYTARFFPFRDGPYEWWEDAIRDERYKLAFSSVEGYRFWEYVGPHDEGPDLLADRELTEAEWEVFWRMKRELDARIEDTPFGP